MTLMKNKFIFIAIFILFAFPGSAQQLPVGSCGIVHIYDASGNRIKRVYFCNNGSDPYPARIQNPNTFKSKSAESLNNEFSKTIDGSENVEFQIIDALYPNPTTGKFSITFSKSLKRATIFITDVNGKTLQRFGANGYKVDFDLSNFSSGFYFVRVENEGNVITKKVVKQ
jgi:hypothetical protein